MSGTLVKLSNAERQLSKVVSVPEAMEVRDIAEAARVYAKAVKAGTLVVNQASRIRIMAERKAGEILAGMELNTGSKNIGNSGGNIVLPPKLEDIGVTKIESSRWQQEAKLPEDEFQNLVSECNENGEWLTSALIRKRVAGAHVGNNNGENEWYTPGPYIDAALAVMGGIDLDPASCEAANGIVGAEQYFTEDDDGLSQEWAGTVWMNPPYSQPAIMHFCEKLTESAKVNQWCALVNNATETKWFQTLARKSSAMAFPSGRVKFWHPDRESAPLQGQAVVYMGDNLSEFVTAFEPFGFVLVKP
jgi:hypothetical protein